MKKVSLNLSQNRSESPLLPVDQETLALRRTAAEIGAAALLRSCPGGLLLGGGTTSVGFFYDFYFPHPFHLHLIEEKMKAIVGEKKEIRVFEMVPFSAAELFRSKGQFSLAEQVEEQKGLAQLIQIGDFYDLSPGPHLKNTAEVGAFKISAEHSADQKIRLVGWCAKSKETLKLFLKKLAHYVEPDEIGRRMGLWQYGVWFAKGLKMRDGLVQFLKNQWFAGALEISAPFVEDRFTFHRSIGKKGVAELWGSADRKTCLQISFFNSSEEEFSSFLQLIRKSLKILGFDSSYSSVGDEGIYWVADGLERSCVLVRAKKILKKGSASLDFYIFAVVEEILFQMLEKNLMMVELENQ